MMELTNTLRKTRDELAGTAVWDEALRTLLLLLAPYAPHLAEELWAQRGQPYSIHNQAWPEWDPALAAEDTVEIVVQVNGKVRDHVTAPAGAAPAALEQLALAAPRVQEWVAGKPVRRVITVPGKLVNILV